MSDLRTLEKQSLDAHVDLCAERYNRLIEDLEDMNDRLDKLEVMVRGIVEKLNDKESAALKTLVKVAGSLILTLAGAIGGLVWYVITHPPA